MILRESLGCPHSEGGLVFLPHFVHRIGVNYPQGYTHVDYRPHRRDWVWKVNPF